MCGPIGLFIMLLPMTLEATVKNTWHFKCLNSVVVMLAAISLSMSQTNDSVLNKSIE